MENMMDSIKKKLLHFLMQSMARVWQVSYGEFNVLWRGNLVVIFMREIEPTKVIAREKERARRVQVWVDRKRSKLKNSRIKRERDTKNERE